MKAAVLTPHYDPAYARLAELAARKAEINRSEAARRRADREAAPPPRTTQLRVARTAQHAEDDFVDARLTELQERERALADREQLIATLETCLDQSRRRLEERLEQLAEHKAAELEPTPIVVGVTRDE